MARAILVFAVLAACSGGDEPARQLPADGSAAAIGAFVDTGGYLGSEWTAETTAPRDAAFLSSPHGRVRVYLDDALLASQAAGNGELDTPPHDVGSMAVKELYYDADTLVGVAAMFRTDPGTAPDATAYFCFGPATRCFTDSPAFSRASPAYGRGLTLECGACHGGTFYTQLP